MPTEPDRTRARQLADESLAQGDPTGWFERLYQEGLEVVPWADLRPNPNLTSWWTSDPGITLKGLRALVVGCGLGDDAEQLAAWGANVTAFDIAPSAIAAALERFPNTTVNYQVADLLNPPPDWSQRFDFVFEAYTLQALPIELRKRAMQAVAGFLLSGGALLIIARARNESDPPASIPWPLTAEELADFDRLGSLRLTWEDYLDDGTRRFRVLYRRL